MHALYLEASLASPYIFLFIASEDGNAYTDIAYW